MISLWMDQVAHEPIRKPLSQDLDVDVVIVGAGFTGLWSAYYLKQARPDLSIVILEAEQVGYGASGRNGGWLMGELAGADSLLQSVSPEQRDLSHKLIHDIPDEVARVINQESIQCDYEKGGVLYCAARYPEQRENLKQQLQFAKELGYSHHDFQWLEKPELDQQLKMHQSQGALFSPHCATIHPAKLAKGLARSLDKKGVRIVENTKVTQWQYGQVKTEHHMVKAKWVVSAVEAYATQFKPIHRYQLAVNSLIIATEPLSDEIWQQIGLENGQAFSEASRLISYGQRTKDNRLVFGARGGYRFAGRLRVDKPLTKKELNLRVDLMQQCFPILKQKNIQVTHAWGGNLGLARNFHPHMLCDVKNGFAMAGGYGGEGVGATNLAGRTLKDLILQKDTVLTQQPWVMRKPFTQLKKWEPEPIRWLTYKALNIVQEYEDKVLSDKNPARWKRKAIKVLSDWLEALTS